MKRLLFLVIMLMLVAVPMVASDAVLLESFIIEDTSEQVILNSDDVSSDVNCVECQDAEEDCPYCNTNVPGAIEDPSTIVEGISPWAVEAIEKARELGILSRDTVYGFPEGIIRDEFVDIIMSALDYMVVKNGLDLEIPIVDNPFKDSDNPSVASASALGLVKGINDQVFDSYSTLTREQMVVIMDRFLDLLDIDPNVTGEYVSFKDEANISDYAKNAMQIMYKAEIIQGVGDKMIDPKGTLTKEQSIALLVRLVERF